MLVTALIAGLLATSAAASTGTGAPSSTYPPQFSGKFRDGANIHISDGKWQGATPMSYTFQWLRCAADGSNCAEIPTATKEIYKAKHADYGHTLEVRVKAKNSAGSGEVISPPSPLIAAEAPKEGKHPVVTAIPQDGQVLAFTPAVFAGTPDFTYSYQWQSCTTPSACTNIPGAEGSTYRPTTVEIGQKLRVLETVRNSAGSSTSPSGPSKPVRPGPPVENQAPIVTGEPVYGQTLSTTPGVWYGTPPFKYAYQWLSCSALTDECSDIPGATESTYSPGPLDVENALEVVVTATNAIGSAPATSAQTSAIGGLLPTYSELPSIIGSLTDGGLLTAVKGIWAGTEPITYEYQWELCNATGEACKAISNATEAALSLIGGEVGSTVRVIVTATNSAGSVSATSPATNIVKALLPSNTTLPGIAGTLIDGSLLSAVDGAWAGTAPLTYEYQWELCNAAGEACKDLAEGSEAVLALISGDVGSTVRVIVTASNSAGATSATSPATTLIGALLPSDATLPSVTGSLIDGSLLSAATGLWEGTGPLSYSYAWELCNSAGGACKAISGEIGSTLKLISGDVGGTIRAVVTATNAAGSTSATSPATSLIGALIPSIKTLPSIAGSLIDGSLLSASSGTWNGTEPISYAYKWDLCNSAGEACKAISGEIGSTLKLISGDVGGTIKAVVTATNAAGSTTATSSATSLIGALIPSNTSLPSVTGSLIDGSLLSAATGSWSGTGPLSYSYAWELCNSTGGACKAISGEIGSTLKLISGDVGGTIKAVVTATNAAGSTTATSSATSLIGALIPSNVGLPSVTGSLIDGSLLSAATGSWSGTGPLSYSYAWELCNSTGGACKAISGEIGSTLKLISGDVGGTIKTVVTATNAAGSTSATSAATSLIGALIASNVGLPSVTGSLIDGSLLSAATGSWEGTGPLSYSYAWELCNSSGGACKAISGEIGSTLKLVSGDVGGTIKAVVTATNAAGSTSATSSATSLIGALIPSNTSLPSVTGSLIDGSLLSAATGSWSGTAPLSYSYAWELCNSSGGACKAISGEIGSTLKLISGDVGGTIKTVVTATNAAGSTSATSSATSLIGALIPSNTSLPSVTGSLIDGSLLSAATGAWEGTGPISYTYAWELCNSTGGACKAISGEIGSTLKLISGDVGGTIKTVVTATNAAGSTTASSPATSLIGALIPSNVGLPSVTGNLIDGSLLSAATGAWEGTGPISYTYAWELCNSSGGACKAISGEIGSTLKLISGDVGGTIKAVVTATNAAGSTSATSSATSLIGALIPSNTSLPSITGSLIDGSLLSAATGSWSGTAPISYSYAWELCNSTGGACKAITGELGSTLKLISADVGGTIRSVVTATNAAGSTSATSSATSLIGALIPSNTSLPSITGTPNEGSLLTAATGSWTGTAPLSYSYAWELCNSTGGACKAISGEIGSTLKLVFGDIGGTIRAVVTATNAAGSTSATSPATSLIGALIPSSTSLPSVTGSLIDGSLLSTSTGGWNGTAPLSYTYAWELCNATGGACKAITGELGSTLKLISGDVGGTIRSVVTATNAAGSTSATSSATSLIGALIPSNTSLPSVSGTLKEGSLLTAATGSWSGTAPISYSYAWELCNSAGGACKAISGEIGSTLKLVVGDISGTIKAVVTATNAAGSTSATSAATGPIAGLLPSNTALPTITTISGLFKVGETLDASTGTWTGTAPITYGYQWELCNVLGGSCSAIAKATGPTYLLGLLDVGLPLRVTVTASNVAGSVPAVSEVTGLIKGLGLDPLDGPAKGGTAVAITGPGVGDATAVHFGNSKASEVEVDSENEVTAVTPPGSGTVGVTVTVPEGTTANSSVDQFTYQSG